MNDLKEFQDWEDHIKDPVNFRRAVLYFAHFGGGQLKSYIHYILKALMTNEYAELFNWERRKGKKKFKESITKNLPQPIVLKVEGKAG